MRVNLQQERPAVPVTVAITKHSIHKQGWVFGITSVCFDRINVDVIVSEPQFSMLQFVLVS